MDWQLIILTLGSSLITGFISIIVNIIVSKANIKKAILENKEEREKEFIGKRMEVYDIILSNLNYLENNINNKNIVDYSELKNTWLKNYHYCSNSLNKHLNMLIHYFSSGDYSGLNIPINNVRNQIKNDLDSYFNINE